MKIAPLSTALLLVASSAAAAVRAPVASRGGMVAAAHPEAARAGAAVLESGGNAVDAAVAAAFAVGVVEPQSSGIGGGGFMVVWLAKQKKAVVIDYRERAPAAASRDMYLGADGNVRHSASTVGYLAAGVPGTAAGLLHALERYGTKSREAALARAIELAAGGFAPDWRFLANREEVRAQLAADPPAAAVFLADGPVVQAELAATLGAIAGKGRDGFYASTVASAIDAAMKSHGGLVTAADLAAYAPIERDPVRGSYRGYSILTMPPPSSGGVHLVQMLNMLEPHDLRGMGYGSAKSVHLLAETMRRAYADRAEFLGDPAFVTVPVAGLTSRGYADALRTTIDPARASASKDIRHGSPATYESDHTTHLSVIDKDGNAVALTQTINTLFGACVVVPGTGILLNNEMDDFSAKPGVPNAFGLVGGDANAIAPGKTPLSSMTPTILLKDGSAFMAVGSPGGSTIITTVLQAIINVVDHRMDIRSAIDAPRIHHQWLPDELRFEAFGLSPDTRALLESMGHAVAQRPNWGNAMGIVRDPQTGALAGAADARGVGEAVAVP